MELNTTMALVTALISAVIGFGLAFIIERRLSTHMPKKSQKILTAVAMMSFGYGLMATVNEVIGFPLQGLHVRYDKLAGFVAVNVLFFPIILLSIAKLIGLKNKAVELDVGAQKNPVDGNVFKYFLILSGVLSLSYFGYAALEGSSSPSVATYDFYTKVDYKNCNSPFADKPSFSLKFLFKKETNEIFMTAEFYDNEEKKQQIQKLDNCSVLDAKNWTCGGEWTAGYRSPKYMFVDGVFSYDKSVSTLYPSCDVRVVKR